MASRASDVDPNLGNPAELLQLRLERLPALIAIQYAVSFVLMFLPIVLNAESSGWVGIWLALLTLFAAYVYQTRRRLAGLMLVRSLLAVWAISLRLFPPAIAVRFALLVIVDSGTLFGARATFVAGLVVTGCVLAAVNAGRLSVAGRSRASRPVSAWPAGLIY